MTPRQVKEFTTKPRKTKCSADEFWEIWKDYIEARKESTSNKQSLMGDGSLSENDVQTPLTVADFCSFAGITPQTFRNYRKEKSSAEGAKELAIVASIAYTRIEAFLTEEGLLGNYNPALLSKILSAGVEEKEDEVKEVIIMSRESVKFAQRDDQSFSQPPTETE